MLAMDRSAFGEGAFAASLDDAFLSSIDVFLTHPDPSAWNAPNPDRSSAADGHFICCRHAVPSQLEL